MSTAQDTSRSLGPLICVSTHISIPRHLTGEVPPPSGHAGAAESSPAWDHQLAEARAGRFGVEKLLFHLAGVPTYILAAELASNIVLRGDLPRPAFPDALRAAAPPRWWGDAQATLAYGRGAYAARGRLAETAGTVATAACQAAHAVLAATGQWVINEKTLLDRAGLRAVDEVLADLTPDADQLTTAVDGAEALLRAAVARTSAPVKPVAAKPAGPARRPNEAGAR